MQAVTSALLITMKTMFKANRCRTIVENILMKVSQVSCGKAKIEVIFLIRILFLCTNSHVTLNSNVYEPVGCE